MIAICIQIKAYGIRCGSPALRGHSRCYFHQKQYFREKPRRQPLLPPCMSSGVRYTFQRLAREMSDGPISTAQLLQVHRQAQKALLRHLQQIRKRGALQVHLPVASHLPKDFLP